MTNLMYDAGRNERYRQEGDDSTFDWFRDYSQIKSLLTDLIPDKNLKILMLGCGNSALSEDMYNDGFKNITNVDVRIKRTLRRYKAGGTFWADIFSLVFISCHRQDEKSSLGEVDGV